MVAALATYHVWSIIMQGRLLFPSLFGILAVCAVGIEQAERTKLGGSALKVCMPVLSALFVSYLIGEIGI